MLFPHKAKGAFISLYGNIVTTNRAFSRQKLKVLFCPLPCGVSKQAARPWFSCGHGSRIYDFSLPYWVDKSFSWDLLLIYIKVLENDIMFSGYNIE
jgi:hypothetical protein